jgi:TetR/AcrR family transcriptional regulator, transcriptional repressor for nem operon
MYESPHEPRRRVRNAAQTRERLLEAAFNEMHRTGFRGSDLAAILGRAGVTKGAMYHHFAGKQAIGYAVVEEVIQRMTRAKWVEPLAKAADPMAALRAIIGNTARDMADLDRGCPLNNITLEMSALDEGFRSRTARIFGEWQGAVAGALRWGQAHGQVKPELDADEEAMFLIAAFEGYLSLAKNSQDPATLEAAQRRLLRQLDFLHP